MEIIERRRDWEAKISARESVSGIAAVNRVAGEGREVAEVFCIAEAIRASAVSPADPGDAHTCAMRKAIPGDDLADDLMARDDSGIAGREFALDDVQVGAADAAGEHSQQKVAGFRVRGGNGFDLERGL